MIQEGQPIKGIKEIKEALKRRDEVVLEPGSTNQSMRPSEGERLCYAVIYERAIRGEELAKEALELAENWSRKTLVKTFNPEKHSTRREVGLEALAHLAEDLQKYEDSNEGYGVYQRNWLNVLHSEALHFRDTREPVFRSLFLRYVTEVFLAGLEYGGVTFVCTWWRAVNYGFSVSPYDMDKPDKDGNYTVQDFPYKSLEEMPEKDKEAFLKTVEDIYFNIEEISCGHISAQDLEAKKEADEADGEQKYVYNLYPEGGYTDEELAEWESVDTKELDTSWIYDIERYSPFIINRFQQAMYYAVKFTGSEYQDYIKSLNGAEDFRSHLEKYGKTRK